MPLPSELVAKLNECASTNFIATRDLWFNRLSWSTVAVAVGLVFEAPELIHDIVAICQRLRDRWKFHITFPERHAPDWVKVVAFTGWVLIVGGVVGEEKAGVQVKDADARIQECSDAKVAKATLEASDANERAALIELSLAPRRLSSKDHDALLKRLLPLKGSQVAVVGFAAGDSEGWAFAMDIAGMLYDAGWNPTAPGATIAMPPVGVPFDPKKKAEYPMGIGISATSKHWAKAKELEKAFIARGFDAKARNAERPKVDDRMDVFVAPRPLGPQGNGKLRLEAERKKQTKSNPVAK